jgi:hypothetical protein
MAGCCSAGRLVVGRFSWFGGGGGHKPAARGPARSAGVLLRKGGVGDMVDVVKGPFGTLSVLNGPFQDIA